MKEMKSRYQKILTFLMKQKKTVTSQEIADALKVSSKTIRNSIKEMNALYAETDFKIQTENGRGFSLQILNREKFREFLDHNHIQTEEEEFQNIIPSQPGSRVNFIIRKLLLTSLKADARVTTEDLEDELFVSTSTLKKDLRNADEVLQDYELKISTTQKNGVRIVGEERKIRGCISDYLFNCSGVTNEQNDRILMSVFGENLTSNVRRISMNQIAEYNLHLTDIAFSNLVVYILIVITRSGRDTTVYRPEDSDSLRKTEEYLCASGIIQEINDSFEIHLDAEVFYLTQILCCSQRFLLDGKNDEEPKTFIREVLQDIKQYIDIDFTKDEQLVNCLALHLKVAIPRMKYHLVIRNELLEEIKNTYPLGFDLAVFTGEEVKKKYQVTVNEEEIGFLAIHFCVALQRKNYISENGHKKKAMIVCHMGLGLTMLLQEKIQVALRDEISIVEVTSMEKLKVEDIDRVDFVFSTIQIPGCDPEKYIRVAPFMQDGEMAMIRDEIKQSNRKSKMLKRIIDYRNVYKEDLFFLGNFHDRESVLDFMTSKMMEYGYINERIKESIFLREEMATTELGGLIALPHPLVNEAKATTISVMVLSEPILWKKDQVQVVFLVCVAAGQYEAWEEIFRNLYTAMVEQNGLKNLIATKEYNRFIADISNNE